MLNAGQFKVDFNQNSNLIFSLIIFFINEKVNISSSVPEYLLN